MSAMKAFMDGCRCGRCRTARAANPHTLAEKFSAAALPELDTATVAALASPYTAIELRFAGLDPAEIVDRAQKEYRENGKRTSVGDDVLWWAMWRLGWVEAPIVGSKEVSS